jgi:hypothetical protein
MTLFLASGITTHAQAPFAKDSDALDKVREAAFRHYMPKEGSKYEERVVCLSADKELSDEFVQRLSLRTAKVVRAAECLVDTTGVQLKTTKEFGVLTSVQSVKWLSGGEAKVEGGNDWSGIGATYSTLRIVYKKGKWVVKSEVITGVS